jgi:hypothetical protein
VLPGEAPPSGPAYARPGHQEQRAHAQGEARGHRREEEGGQEVEQLRSILTQLRAACSLSSSLHPCLCHSPCVLDCAHPDPNPHHTGRKRLGSP